VAVRAQAVDNTQKKKTLLAEIRNHVLADSAIFNTNGLENFWSLRKRGLKGAYISVEPYPLFRYLEQMFCDNNARDSRIKTASTWPCAKSSASA